MIESVQSPMRVLKRHSDALSEQNTSNQLIDLTLSPKKNKLEPIHPNVTPTLKRQKIEQIEENECLICFTKYTNNNPKTPIHLAQNDIFHYMCYECLVKTCYTSVNGKFCPWCQTDLDIVPSLNIYLACKFNLEDKASKLLRIKKYNKINFVDKSGKTPLIWACENELSVVAFELIKTGKSKPYHVDNNGDTALIYAHKNKLVEVVDELLKLGCKSPV